LQRQAIVDNSVCLCRSSSANAPRLTRELALNPASLGLLTDAYLLAFGMMQIPAGTLAGKRDQEVVAAVASPRTRKPWARMPQSR
jgi:hypothetical protein